MALKASKLILSLLIVSVFAACSKSATTLGLISDQQTIPMPSFYASDESTSGKLPRFAQIRVYELTSSCTPPNCPIVWDVVVSARHAPNEFVYGGFPGFGAQTIIPAQALKPGAEYMLVTLPDEYGSRSGYGTFSFYVTEQGRVLEKK